MNRRWQKATILITLVFSVLFLVSSTILAKAGHDQGDKPEATSQNGLEKAVEKAVLDEIEKRGDTILAAVLYETRVQNIRISGDGKWASAELAPFDPQAQMVLPVEPGLAILRRQGGLWKTTLPEDHQWKAWLQMLPADVMSAEALGGWLEIYDSTQALRPEAALGGYKLPWPFGQTRYVSQSTAHDRYGGGVDHFAWDFYALGGGSVVMWNVLAARPGKVYMIKESDPNGCDPDSGCNGNYIVLKDESTYPVTYQLYLHLAQNSVPDNLHIGDLVNQGQFLGVADDTGRSTGHHLHFMVHTTSYSYWGTAIDITFDDVDINGGRPRILIDKNYCTRPEDVCNTFRDGYVSGNKPDPEPPTGDISNITTGQLITSNTLTVTGWGADISSGFGTAQLLAAPRNGTWQVVGPAVSGTPFSIPVDLCQSGLPVGPTSLGLRLMDTSGYVVDLTALRWVTLDFACNPPPVPAACVPGPGQAAIFDETNFQGACKILPPGGFPDGSSLSPLGGGKASSLLLGSGARVTLYSKTNFDGRSETFNASDSSLADNRIQNNSVNSLFVRLISDQPFPPQPSWPPAGQVISDTNSLTLYWMSSEGNLQYQVELTNPAGEVLTSSWLNEPWWNLANGQALKHYGPYLWRVRSRMLEKSSPLVVLPKYANQVYLPMVQQAAGAESKNASSWSSLVGFTYSKGDYRPSPLVSEADFNAFYSAPITESLNSSWTRTGLWAWENTIIPWTGGTYFWYGERDSNNDLNYARAHSGALTTPPIQLSSEHPLLRFWYYYDTEVKSGDITRSSTKYWDQRWVQVSVDGSPYINLYLLSGEAGNEWQESPFIPIPATTGQIIRLRFYFDTIDGIADGLAPDNYYMGWFVDDVSIVSSGPGLCTDVGEPDNLPWRATLLAAPYQLVTNHKICPEDEDYYAFSGTVGDKVVVDIDARTLQPVSALDSVVELIDSDGNSVLAYNDDEGSGKLDSYLTYQLPRSGLYFVRVHNYYLYEGGSNFNYNLRFYQDGVKPQVDWLIPGNGSWIPKTGLALSVQATDGQSGVAKVEFFMHDSNWTSLTWTSLGQATGTNSVYSLMANPETDFGTQGDMALFALVTDKAGNTTASSIWNLRSDYEIPSASLSPLALQQATNTFHLSWTGADTISGLDHYELQRQVDSGVWEDLYTKTLLTGLWEVVLPGHTYTYRMRSVDKAGNASDYQSTITSVPTAATICANAPHPGEPDNTFETAFPLQLGQAQAKSFCNLETPLGPDVDWISLEVQAGNRYWLIAYPPPGSPAAPVLTLYGADGQTPVIPGTVLAPALPGSTASLFWTSNITGVVLLRVENADPSVIGAPYNLSGFIEAGRVYLPVIGR